MTKLLKIIACAATLLPLGQLQAKDFGGLNPKKTFTLVVKRIESVDITTSKREAVPIPKGVPTFMVGQKIKFTVGSKGELMGKGFNVPFRMSEATSSSTSANTYSTQPKLPASQAARNRTDALMYSKKGMPGTGSLFFGKIIGPAVGPKYILVSYALEAK